MSWVLVLSLLGAPPLVSQQRAQVGRDMGHKPISRDPAVIIGELNNGLRYYVRRNRTPAARAEMRLVVKAGSALEDSDQRGLAHFVEHMAFNGTRRFRKHELVNYLETVGMTMGADINATTEYDATTYKLTLPTDSPRVITKGLEILAEWANGLSFDPDEIERERKVVIEEWRLGLGPAKRIRTKQQALMLDGSRYAERDPIGLKSALENATVGQLRRFYTDWYRPDLMAVVVVGDLDPFAMEVAIRRRFASIHGPKAARRHPVFALPARDTTRVAIAVDSEATGATVSVSYLRPHRDRATVADLQRGLSEELYRSMLDDRLARAAGAPGSPIWDAGSRFASLIPSVDLLAVNANVKRGQIAQALELLIAEAMRTRDSGFTAGELERTKRIMLRNAEHAHLERRHMRSSYFAADYVAHFLTRRPIPSIEAEVTLARRLLPTIGSEDIQRVAREWLALRHRIVLASAPAHDEASIPSIRALSAVCDSVTRRPLVPYREQVVSGSLIDHEPTPGRVLREESVRELGVHRWTLSNGIRVILKPTTAEADQVLFTAYRAGGTSVAADSIYVPAATAAAVIGRSGLGAHDASALDQLLAGRLAQVDVHLGTYDEGLNGSASPKDLRTLFELIYLRFTAPRTDSVAFHQYRAQLRESIVVRKASPVAAFADSLGAIMTQHHPRAQPISNAWVDRMDLDKSFEFYKERFGDAGDFTFVFVGAFTPDSIRPLIEQYLGGLPVSSLKEHRWRDIGVSSPGGVTATRLARGKEPKSQTEIVFSGSADSTRETRYLLGSLALVLNNRLWERLRQQMAGTYGTAAVATISLAPAPSYAVSISFSAEPARLDELSRAVFAEIEQLKTAGPTVADIAKVREQQRRERETTVQTNAFWLRVLSAYDRAGYPFVKMLHYDALVRELTVERIREAAKQYLNLERYVQLSLYPEEP